jgi:predicted secreted hydrolase
MNWRRCFAALLLAATVAVPTHGAPPIYPPVVGGHTLLFPRDYGAHPEYRTEWWYATGRLMTAQGKHIGFQVTFFRSADVDEATRPLTKTDHFGPCFLRIPR